MIHHIGFLLLLVTSVSCRQSIWSKTYTHENAGNFTLFPNSMFRGGYVTIQILCTSQAGTKIQVQWILEKVRCLGELFSLETQVKEQEDVLSNLAQYIYQHRNTSSQPRETERENATANEKKATSFQIGQLREYACGDTNLIYVEDEASEPYLDMHAYNDRDKQMKMAPNRVWNEGIVFEWETQKRQLPPLDLDPSSHRAVDAWEDGLYRLMLTVRSAPRPGSTDSNTPFKADVVVQMKGTYGYLPAIVWPLYPVRGVLSFVYLLLGTAWILIWARAHQHTLKIHIVIGTVAVAGAMANTMEFVDLSAMDSNGKGIKFMQWLGLILGSWQGSLTQLLLMIVSTGYGITRPTLTKTVRYVAVALTMCNFVAGLALSVVEDESLKLKYNHYNVTLVVFLLALLMWCIIGGWIMVYSILTFIHLTKRKHAQKMTIMFTVFTCSCVIAFAALFAAAVTKFSLAWSCGQEWKYDWVFVCIRDFELLLLMLVLMWLWRPTDAAQSYAFTPLSTKDGGVDGFLTDEEDEETELYSNGKLKLEMDKVALGPLET